MQRKLVVYTVAIGVDFDLPPAPVGTSADFLCFSDKPIEATNGWTIVSVTPFIPGDSHRSSREYKLRPHRYLGRYDRSIYIDTRVELLRDPAALWDHLIPNDNVVFGGFFHSFRDTVADEFKAVTVANLDFPERINEQREVYAEHHPEVLTEQPVWGGILARCHNTQDCIAAMEVWFAHVLRFSRRDQLSLPLALSALAEEQKNIVHASNRLTDFHRWPPHRKPRPENYRVAPLLTPSQKRNAKIVSIIREVGLLTGYNHARRLVKDIFTRRRDLPANTAFINFEYDEDIGLYSARDIDGPGIVFVSDKKRLKLYKSGIAHRQKWLLDDYRLPDDLVGDGDLVVDVGANIGELGRWVESLHGRYVAFEPDPLAYRALQNNVVSRQIFDVALSNENGTADFYLSTSDADSSLFRPPHTDAVVTVRKATLDSFLAEEAIVEPIRLLKIEAEGMEPEVLAGARETLRRSAYVAVDAGPERGGDNTVKDVFRELVAADFEVIDCFLARGTFLFVKRPDLGVVAG